MIENGGDDPPQLRAKSSLLFFEVAHSGAAVTRTAIIDTNKMMVTQMVDSWKGKYVQ